MRRSSLSTPLHALAFVALTFTAIGCTDEGVGDPCIPEAIPCDTQGGNCGYKASESYLETSSVQCRSRLCIVHKLDNGTQGDVPSDPRSLCEDNDGAEGCLSEERLERSVYCTCRCRIPSDVNSNQEPCACPDGFACVDILNQGGPGVRGGYCVRRETAND
jgi:hypothetical protein